MYAFLDKIIKSQKSKFKVSDEDKNTLFERTDTKIGRIANYTVIFFILLSIVVVGIDTIPKISDRYWFHIFIVDFIISSVFLFEYAYRWRFSDEKLRFPFRFMNILDFLSFFPFFVLILIYGIGSYSIFAIFRIFRVFRIFELVERVPIVTKILKGVITHKIEYLSAIFVIFIMLTVFSTLVYLSEQSYGNAELFNSLPNTIWWAVVTMTTTGYGDMIPLSSIGKIIASFLMFLGPILIAILSSITVIVFIESTKIIDIPKKTRVCTKCRAENDNDAKFCKRCGEKL